jgi:hypothetical protein
MLYGSAMAATYTFPDNTDSWPGYVTWGLDDYGTPKISSMEVTINDNTSNLESVVINLTGRQYFDSLFINTGGDGLSYEAWDYYVKGFNPNVATLYTVAAQYDYMTATEANHPYPRPDHPVGFDSGITPDNLGLLASVLNTATGITYTFNAGIVMDSGWAIGYAPWCANDVILSSPVPEPSMILLLGMGLLGVGLLRRKK